MNSPHCLSPECETIHSDNTVPLLRAIVHCRNRCAARAAAAEQKLVAVPPPDGFYIASLYHTRGESICWFNPNNCGYTLTLDTAGVYTQADLDANPGYYDSDRNRAIPCAEVAAVARHLVTVDSEKLRKLVSEVDFRAGKIVCEHCGEVITANARGSWETVADKGRRCPRAPDVPGNHYRHVPRRKA